MHESGAWFVSDSTFSMFTVDTFPGYSADPVPIVPLLERQAPEDVHRPHPEDQNEGLFERAAREG